MKKFLLILFLLLLFLLGFYLYKHCGTDLRCMKDLFLPPPTPTLTATFTAVPLKPGVKIPTPTKTPTATNTFTHTLSPTKTFTSTTTSTPTHTPTVTNSFTPTHSPTSTHTNTFTPICTANPNRQGIMETEPNENETQANSLGTLGANGDLVVYGTLSRVGRGSVTAGLDRDVYKVDLETPGCMAILDCYTYVPGFPNASRHDPNFQLNVYDQLFAPITNARQGGPIEVVDLRQNPTRIYYFEVVGADGRPGGRYRLTIRK